MNLLHNQVLVTRERFERDIQKGDITLVLDSRERYGVQDMEDILLLLPWSWSM